MNFERTHKKSMEGTSSGWDSLKEVPFRGDEARVDLAELRDMIDNLLEDKDEKPRRVESLEKGNRKSFDSPGNLLVSRKNNEPGNNDPGNNTDGEKEDLSGMSLIDISETF